jgi:hypothetical protein
VTGWDALAFMGLCTRAQALTAVECDYVALAAATAVHSAGLRAELDARRRRRVVQHGAVLGRDGTFAECRARNRAILAGAR